MAFGLLYDYLMGQTIDAYKYFGAHFEKQGDVDGVMFRLYAPCASDVSVIGEWNGWDVTRDKLNRIDDSGTWELFIPGLFNYQSYKFHFKNAKGEYVDKADPFAFYSEYRPATCSRLFDYTGFIWHDSAHMKSRTRNFDKPMSIYEIHLDLMRRADSLEKTLMLGKIEGRRRGRQRMNGWVASPTQWTWVWVDYSSW